MVSIKTEKGRPITSDYLLYFSQLTSSEVVALVVLAIRRTGSPSTIYQVRRFKSSRWPQMPLVCRSVTWEAWSVRPGDRDLDQTACTSWMIAVK